MMLLSLVVLFMVIRPLVRRILAAEVIPALTAEDRAAPALTDGTAEAAGGQSLVPAAPEPGRRRPGAGPGPCPDGASRRRTGRAQPE